MVAEKLDIREFARDKHRTVDDVPLGGGVGMVLKPMSWQLRLLPVVWPKDYLSPRGGLLNQVLVRDLVAAKGAVFLWGVTRSRSTGDRLGQYDGVSIGDYILSGGETAALTVMDAVVAFCRVLWEKKLCP